MTLDEIKEATLDAVTARISEIKDVEMIQRDANLDDLTTETDALIARKQELISAQDAQIKRNKLNALLNKGDMEVKPINPISNEADEMIERKAFMNYVIKGVRDVDQIKRANNPNVSTDLGVMIPKTVQQEIITEINKIYGSLYAKVLKLNIPGGVEYPIGSFSATFNRIGETGAPTDRQKGGSITGSIVFKYNIGEIRLSKTYFNLC